MMKINVQTIDGKADDAKVDIALSEAVFGVDVRADILHRVVTWQLEKRRAPARAARERGDVARTGKKFGRQKGGGTARHGNRRAPIFVGGGKAHGPRARSFGHSLNKKIRTLGLKMALSDKATGGKLRVVDTLDLAEAKTRVLANKLGELDLGARTLFIDSGTINANFVMAASNLRGIDALPAIGANVYDILRADTLVLTRGAVEKLEGRCNG